jgi:hypothetical protein
MRNPCRLGCGRSQQQHTSAAAHTLPVHTACGHCLCTLPRLPLAGILSLSQTHCLCSRTYREQTAQVKSRPHTPARLPPILLFRSATSHLLTPQRSRSSAAPPRRTAPPSALLLASGSRIIAIRQPPSSPRVEFVTRRSLVSLAATQNAATAQHGRITHHAASPASAGAARRLASSRSLRPRARGSPTVSPDASRVSLPRARPPFCTGLQDGQPQQHGVALLRPPPGRGLGGAGWQHGVSRGVGGGHGRGGGGGAGPGGRGCLARAARRHSPGRGGQAGLAGATLVGRRRDGQEGRAGGSAR